jgi:hypothetical protein
MRSVSVVDSTVNEIARRALDLGQTQFAVTKEGRFRGQSVAGPSGISYVVVLQTLAHPFAELLHATPAYQLSELCRVCQSRGWAGAALSPQ